MKLVDNKFSMTLLQHYLHNLYNILTRYGFDITGYYNFYSQVFLWITFLRESAHCAESLLRLVPNQPPLSHTVLWCMMWLVTIQPPVSLAGSTGTIQHTVLPAHCAASPLLPSHALPGSPELLIFSPLEATAVAKGWQCSNLRVTHPHLPFHQQTSLL